MDLSVLGILRALIEQACLLLVVFFLLFHIKFFNRMLAGKLNILDQVILAVIFGIFAVYGTQFGFKTTGAIANIRNLGPMMAGLLAGPWAGLGAGLIGGVQRYFVGGFTQVPCAIGTIVSGLAGGLLFMLWKGKIGIWKPTLFAFIMEAADMGLLLVLATPFDDSWKLVQVIAIPMIVSDTVGILIFAFLLKELKARFQTG